MRLCGWRCGSGLGVRWRGVERVGVVRRRGLYSAYEMTSQLRSTSRTLGLGRERPVRLLSRKGGRMISDALWTNYPSPSIAPTSSCMQSTCG
jgi:hypothetical protein